ncbi:MAG: alanine--tRNA ligase, partial [Clostridia bacterium]|nr:alanine--tRNA ligase [Clostridia bacterium]
SGAITGFDVVDTKKTVDGIFTHIGTATNTISVGDNVNVKIDVARREAIRRNHTAAHLLQAALRQVLGTHVEQAGQLVNEKAVRFDFTHFSALTSEETQQVETLVNTAILDGIVVDNREMPIDEARALGAMALFGEKYGDIVRVVKAGDFSTELCGGTHVDNTGKIGLFRIISESGIAAGTRRIEAYTGFNVVNLINHYKSLLADTAATLKIGNIEDVAVKAAATVKQMKEDSKKIESLEAKLASGKLNDLMANAIDINGVKVATAKFDGTAPDELRKMIDTIKAENDDAVAVLAAVNGEKLTFCAGVGKAALAKGAHAGNIVKAVAQIAGGNGGGKPDSAMAGGKEIAKAQTALDAVCDIVLGMVK